MCKKAILIPNELSAEDLAEDMDLLVPMLKSCLLSHNAKVRQVSSHVLTALLKSVLPTSCCCRQGSKNW